MFNNMVSVIIPLYNKEKIISVTISSVLAQVHTDFELIIVNDGSTDHSLDAVSKFDDSRIKVVNQQNQGVSAARNKGILEAIGEWVLFLDADDILEPYCLSELLNAQSRYKTPIVVGNFFILDKNKKLTTFLSHSMKGVSKYNFKNLFFQRFYLRMGNSLFKRDILLDNLFDVSLQRYEDFEFFYRLVSKYKVAVISRELCVHTHKYSDLATLFDFFNRDYISKIDLSGKSFWEKMNLSLLLREGLLNLKYKKLLHIDSKERYYISLARILYFPVRVLRKIKKTFVNI